MGRRRADAIDLACREWAQVRRRPTEPRQMATLLGGFDRAEDARAACERA